MLAFSHLVVLANNNRFRIPVNVKSTDSSTVLFSIVEPLAGVERAGRKEGFYEPTSLFVRQRMQALLAASAPARVREMPGTSHLLFLSHHGQVLREMRAFMASLP